MTDSPDGMPVRSHRAPFLSQGGYIPAPYAAPDKDEYLTPVPDAADAARRKQVVAERIGDLADTPCRGR